MRLMSVRGPPDRIDRSADSEYSFSISSWMSNVLMDSRISMFSKSQPLPVALCAPLPPAAAVVDELSSSRLLAVVSMDEFWRRLRVDARNFGWYCQYDGCRHRYGLRATGKMFSWRICEIGISGGGSPR